MGDKKIAFYKSFSSVDKILNCIFSNEDSESGYEAICLNEVIEAYNFVGDNLTLLVLDVGAEGLTDEYVYLNDYFPCPKIYIFETFEELYENASFLSKHQINGIVKGEALREVIIDILMKNGFTDGENDYFVIENIELKTKVNILMQIKSISEDCITVSNPGIAEISQIESTTLFLKNLNHIQVLNQDNFEIKEEKLILNIEAGPLIDQLRALEYKSEPKLTIALISDKEPDYTHFHSLGVKVNHYSEAGQYNGVETLVIVNDKLILAQTSSGTKICQEEIFEGKSLLLYNRKLPVNRYAHKNIETTTDYLTQPLIREFINDNTVNRNENVFEFQKKSNLSDGIMKTKAKIISLNECYIKILIPFRLEESCKVKLDFLGNSHLTVTSSQPFQGGFQVELHIDSFTENELNRLRRIINKLHYLNEKSIDISRFITIDEIESYEYIEQEVENV